MMLARVARSMRLVMQAKPTVPVLVYHSIGPDNGHPIWGPLTLPVEVFEAQLQWFQRAGFHTVTLRDLHAHLAHGASLPPRPILLTFDDAFLDSWVHACPLLEHYGFQGTVFLCPAFVQRESGVRPRAEVRGTRTPPDEWWGYLRWDEARALLASGAFDIQSHALTHHRQFTSSRIVDYLSPDTAHYWCEWNAHPDQQPYWLSRPFVRPEDFGLPVYEHSESLVAPRYTPDAGLDAHTQAIVANGGGPAFFETADWHAQLDGAVREYRRAHGENGHTESHEEYLARARNELTESRAILQQELDIPIDFLCWPVDMHTEEVHALALDVGFTATTCLNRPNVPGADPTRIGRTYWGQSDESYRVNRAWILLLKSRGVVQLLRGRRSGYLNIFLANRLMRWYDHPARQPRPPRHAGV